MSFHEHGLKLSDIQKRKLATALKRNEGTSIKLDVSQLEGPDKVLLTKRQQNKIEKMKNKGVGLVIQFSKNQLVKMRSIEGGFLGALLPIAKALLPGVGNLLGNFLNPIATAGGEKIASKIRGEGLNKKISGGKTIHPDTQTHAMLQAPQDQLNGGFLPLLAMAAPLIAGLFSGRGLDGNGLSPMGYGLTPMGSGLTPMGMNVSQKRKSKN